MAGSTVKHFAVSAARTQTAKRGKTGGETIPFTVGTAAAKEEFHVLAPEHINHDAMITVGAMALVAIQSGDVSKATPDLIEMMGQLFTEDSVRRFLLKLRDRRDPFGWKEMGEIIEWAVEAHAARPTTS